MKKQRTRNAEIQSRIPFPTLPLPTKCVKIRQAPRVIKPEHELEPEPEPTQEPYEPVKKKPIPKPAPPEKPPPREPVGHIEVPEVQVGGVLEKEEPKKIDKGTHVIEGLDYSDYSDVT